MSEKCDCGDVGCFLLLGLFLLLIVGGCMGDYFLHEQWKHEEKVRQELEMRKNLEEADRQREEDKKHSWQEDIRRENAGKVVNP